MAMEGDIQGLLSALADGMQRGINARPLLAHVQVAIDVLARRDPTAFSQFVAREKLKEQGQQLSGVYAGPSGRQPNDRNEVARFSRSDALPHHPRGRNSLASDAAV